MSLALLHASARLDPFSFSVHLSTVIGIIGLAVLYEWAARREWRAAPSAETPAGSSPLGFSAAPTAAPTGGQRACFYAGLLTMFVSLNGWIHDLSDDYLFAAHMLQHLLLAIAVAPLMIMGTPGGMLRPALSVRGVGPLARWLTRPTHTFAIFNVVFAAWHLPLMYNFALAHHWMHIIQHLMFLVASVLMWWPVLSPLPELPRLSYPGQMLYLFLLTIPMAIVAVYITYADTVLYPMYATAPRVWGITPMQDQLIGGLLMWIPGGLFFFAVISVIFFRWQQRDGVESAAGAQVDWRAPGELELARTDR